MSSFRKDALNRAYSHTPLQVNNNFIKSSDIFGTNVFSREVMRKYLSADAYEDLMGVIEKGYKINFKTANEVASAMKIWALSKGATHYTHWFQPLTGSTAEKHDAFLTPVDDMHSIELFDGSQLRQQEPDASSFPSGGIRNTFEARGYTAWDPASPAFVIGGTLCIPTIFISYTGDTLDYKAPLLKALNLLDKAAVSVCQLFDNNISKVFATLGCEQEYFLIDEALFFARPDLVMSGRTLFGHSPAKGQQLEDHYFGSIPERVTSFMKDIEFESWKLGIPLKTRHNEVAPNQFEFAPVYEEVNIANDHNQLIMDIMSKMASKHNFRISFHEKPFNGINGSGKHNNWSLMTNTGINLLTPGKTPNSNLQFLSFFINTIKAVHDYADLLRASIASAGNDHRLGANEAPPAIMSVFIGSQLTAVLNDIESRVKSGKMTDSQKLKIKLDIAKIPEIIVDNTDRNRTSPFAFTGNKFEFRAVGSSANCSSAMIILNSIVANQLLNFRDDVDDFIEKGMKKDEAILKVLREYIIKSKSILFEGNGYSADWIKEAAKRGLKNIKSTPEALNSYISPENIKMLSKNNILSERELNARFSIEMENYFKKIQIEARILGDIALNHIIPTAVKYQNLLIENVKGLQMVLISNSPDKSKFINVQMETIIEISEHIRIIKNKVNEMVEQRKKANKIEDVSKKANYYCSYVKPFFDEIRYHVDKLELLVDDELWTLPKYRELFFIR